MTHCPCHAMAARADSDEVLVSAYRRRGDALLIVSNFLGHEDRTVTLQPHPERLRLGAELEVRGLLSGGAILVRDGAIKPALQERQARYAGPVAPTCQWTAEDDAGSFDDDTV